MNHPFSKLRRGFFEPLLALKGRSPKLSYWRLLEETQFLPQRALENIQQKRFMSLWNFLWKNNEFYRQRFWNHGLNEKSVQNIDDLTKLPILTKKEIRLNTDQMISRGYDKSRLHHFKTGGSTGKALDIFITDACSELRNACARRHDRWAGWEPGEPIGAVWGNPHLPETIKAKLINTLVQPFIYLDTMAMTDASVAKFAADWQKHRPTVLFGHAHSLFMLAKFCDRVDLSKIRPKGVISTSMMLLPHERVCIERAFGCRVTDRYGCEEVSLIGSECDEHCGLHMNIEHLIIEFVRKDGSPAKPGEPGRIIVTDLMNLAMPFVRYSIEDVGARINESCSCGRDLPLMSSITGRVADFLIKKDGTKIAGVSIIENTLTKIPAIDQMQIVQENVDTLNVNIVPGSGYDESTGAQIIGYFQKLFAADIRVTLNLTTEIAPEPSGKYRFSICRIPQN